VRDIAHGRHCRWPQASASGVSIRRHFTVT
jgi:hypothetical protein